MFLLWVRLPVVLTFFRMGLTSGNGAEAEEWLEPFLKLDEPRRVGLTVPMLAALGADMVGVKLS